MDMVNVRLQSQQCESMLDAALLDEFFAGCFYFARENLAPIFRYPYEMRGDLGVGPRVLPVCRVLFIGV